MEAPQLRTRLRLVAFRTPDGYQRYRDVSSPCPPRP